MSRYYREETSRREVWGDSEWDSHFGSDMLYQMRQHMAEILSRLGGPAGNATEIDVIEPFPSLPFPSIDLDKGNTTSVTKIIDGHKVVINETEYKDEGANGGAYFKVRIIDVKPDSSELTTERDAEGVTSRDRESIESSAENEITKNKELETPLASRNVESFDEVDRRPSRRRPYGDYYSYNYWDDIEPLYPIDANGIDFVPINRERPVDLSRDTYVNDLLAQAGAPTNPDAEFIDFNSQDFRPFERTTRR